MTGVNTTDSGGYVSLGPIINGEITTEEAASTQEDNLVKRVALKVLAQIRNLVFPPPKPVTDSGFAIRHLRAAEANADLAIHHRDPETVKAAIAKIEALKDLFADEDKVVRLAQEILENTAKNCQAKDLMLK